MDSINNVLLETNITNSILPNHLIEMLKIMGSDQWTSLELMKKMKLSSKSSFIKHYLKPALDAGVIAMTNPAAPTSKNQKYYKK